MKIPLFLFFFFCFSSFQYSFAQTPQEQMQQATSDLMQQIADEEKLIADAKKNNEDPDTIKSMEEELAQLKQQLAMVQRAAKTIVSLPNSLMNEAADKVDSENDSTYSIIPEKKTALLNALPKDELNQAQLQTFINTLYADLKNKISPQRVGDAQKIINQLENDPIDICINNAMTSAKKGEVQTAQGIREALRASNECPQGRLLPDRRVAVHCLVWNSPAYV